MNNFFCNNRITVLDGAMGSFLQQKGISLGKIPEEININNPQVIKEIHREYIKSGAQVIYANTFGLNPYKTAESAHTLEEMISAAIKNAREAAKGTEVKVAVSFGPLGVLLKPSGEISFDEAYDSFKRMVLASTEADLIVFETFSDLLEIKAAVLAAKENSSLPVAATMTFEENGRSFAGVLPACAAITLDALNVDALGVNCSLEPEKLIPMLKQMSQYTHKPLIAKANAGLPDSLSGKYSVLPDEFCRGALEFIESGATVIGGCCGTTPEYIQKISGAVTGLEPARRDILAGPFLCSATQVERVSRPLVVGERINPTGKKAFKEALARNDIDYILARAIEQVQAGAHILDVNLGLPGIDEKKMMETVVCELQGTVDTPLQIDSSDANVIETALRRYAGKALINSVNGEEEKLEAILPAAKKYGAAIVGLTLDENGIPDSASGRLKIAEKIVEKANSYGISKDDIFIDCLTLTVSARQSEAANTLSAVRLVKEKLGVKTILGVSNVSFGLPQRVKISSAFLTLALESGLDLAIINPNEESMMSAFRAYCVLSQHDSGCEEYINAYSGAPKVSASDAVNHTLRESIIGGMKEAAAALTQEKLNEKEPLEIVNCELIPALDEVGEMFEKGTLFLPGLLRSASAAGAAFDVVKAVMKSSGEGVSKGKIVLATVKGDIHDIGKNIVKVVLENYGYTVYDLGKDVAPQAVLDKVLETGASLVGLSALMTTTVVSMAETIKLLKENTDVKIMVGGAVLTEEYSYEIGADYYCKDAKASADAAKQFFEK